MLSALRVLLLIGSWWMAQTALADAPLRVLTSIKPLQLIAIAVGGDAIRVDVLLDPQFSPHDYQLRPSDRTKLSGAEVIFWVGPKLEAFLQTPLNTLSARATIVDFQDADADPHVWMDPVAAIQIGRRMAETFAKLRPERAAYFEARTQQLTSELSEQDVAHRAQLKQLPPLRGFMVTHDAYTRFERRYGFSHRAALTDAADIPPSAKSLAAIERELDQGRIACILRQPQETKLYQRLTEGRNIRTATIDAMGVEIPSIADGAVLFYQRLWEAVLSCLAG